MSLAIVTDPAEIHRIIDAKRRSLPVDAKEILYQLGVHVEIEADLEPDCYGALVKENQNYIYHIPPNLTKEEERVSLAQGVGYYVKASPLTKGLAYAMVANPRKKSTNLGVRSRTALPGRRFS